jgi:hypothetical protein
MGPEAHTITPVTTAPLTIGTLWDDLARETETLFELSVATGVPHHRELAGQISRLEAASTALRMALHGLNRRHHVDAPLYDQLDALITSSLHAGTRPHGIPLLSAAMKDLAARVSYAARYPAMVQYTMLCDSTAGQNWPHHTSVRTAPEIIAAQLSLAALLAQQNGEAVHDWLGYTLTERHRSAVSVIAATYPVLDQPPRWFGHDIAAQRWALEATGVLGALDVRTLETALGLLDGWGSSVRELLETAQLLTR